MSESQALLSSLIEAIKDKKGRNITQVDLSKIDYATTQGFVICTGNTPIQVNAIADNVREAVAKQTGIKPYNYDGYANSQWIVIDYGTIYVHVFLPEYREKYRLEELWNDASIVNIPDLD